MSSEGLGRLASSVDSGSQGVVATLNFSEHPAKLMKKSPQKTVSPYVNETLKDIRFLINHHPDRYCRASKGKAGAGATALEAPSDAGPPGNPLRYGRSLEKLKLCRTPAKLIYLVAESSRAWASS